MRELTSVASHRGRDPTRLPSGCSVILSIGGRRAGLREVLHDNNVGTLVLTRHFEQPQEPLQGLRINTEVVSRQLRVPFVEPYSEHADGRVQEMNLRSGPYSVRQFDLSHAVIAKEEAIVKDDINGAPQKLGWGELFAYRRRAAAIFRTASMLWLQPLRPQRPVQFAARRDRPTPPNVP